MIRLIRIRVIGGRIFHTFYLNTYVIKVTYTCCNTTYMIRYTNFWPLLLLIAAAAIITCIITMYFVLFHAIRTGTLTKRYFHIAENTRCGICANSFQLIQPLEAWFLNLAITLELPKSLVYLEYCDGTFCRIEGSSFYPERHIGKYVISCNSQLL